MCRALRGPRQQQVPPPSGSAQPKADYASNYYADRLCHLKRVLKPYRDNNVNRLRTAVGSGCRSARVNLNRHWKSLENLLAPCDHRKERDQNAVNEKLQERLQLREDAENAVPAASAAAADVDAMTSDAAERLHALNVGR
ncbi:Hypothetical protein CINCED_3A020222 [Cinara cedri]|uniref:Uncharacterized protein n=1 Tax=Cinara cedri TaxID=506608 RepID=A0A5E4N0Z7_9HEMI|nr:Hypothetical protein CINCED_3A020222 [Cinara cedri]